MRTMQQLAQLALDVQDACNLSGVVRSFAQVTEDLWVEARRQGFATDWVNQHPVSKLFADKIADLARVRDFVEYSRAHDACSRIAKGEEVEIP
jgi:hypothetical protein